MSIKVEVPIGRAGRGADTAIILKPANPSALICVYGRSCANRETSDLAGTLKARAKMTSQNWRKPLDNLFKDLFIRRVDL